MKKSLIVSLLVLFSVIQTAEAKNYTLKTGGSQPSAPKVTTPVRSNASNVTDFSSSFCQAFNSGVFGDSANAASITPSSVLLAGLDPYFVEIDGVRYMLIKDNNDNVFNEKDILGINDSQKNIFASLRPLDINRDLLLTGEELTNAGVRLVKLNSDGKLDYQNRLNDYPNSNIEFIYLTELRKAYKNNGSTGQFGQYDVVIKNNSGKKSLVTGLVTFETKEQVKKYF